MNSNNFAEKFSGALFNYLWYTEEIITDAEIAEAFDLFGNAVNSIKEFVDVLGFVTQTAKAVVVLSVLTFPSFDKTVEDYFERKAITRLNVSKFLARHCLQHHAENDDIFEVILNTFSFIYRTVVFCLKKFGAEKFVPFPALCWTKIFEADLNVDFHARGGWGEFKTYVAENRYTLKYGDAAQTAIAAFQAEIDDLYPIMNPEWNNPQPSDHQSDETMENLKEFLVVEPQTNGEEAAFSFSTVSSNVPGFYEGEASVENVDKLPTNGEAAERSFGTVSSNIPGFNEEGEACVEKVEKLPTNGEAAERSIGPVSSNIIGFNEEGEACVEKMGKQPTNNGTAERPFGTVASNIPGFNQKSEACLKGVDKIQTNGEAAEFSIGTVSSNIPGFDEKGEACVEKVVKLPRNGEAAERSFGTVSSNISGFNEEGEACVEKVDKLPTNGEAAERSIGTVSSNIPGFNGEGEACVEKVGKQPTNDETAERPFGTVASNIPGFNQKSEACLKGVDKLQTNGEAAEFSIGTVSSNIPGFNGEGEACVEKMEKLQTNDKGFEFSFGTVDEIISNIPGFNEKNEAVVFQFDNANTNKVKTSKKKSKRKRRGKSRLPASESSINPVINNTAIEELSQACLSMQISEVDHCSIECNSTSEDGVKTVETSTAIKEDSKGEIIQENSGKEVSDSDSKATSHKGIPNLGKYALCTKTPELQSTRQEGMLAKDDQSSCQDLIYRQATETPLAVNPNLLFDKLYVNGEIFDKYTIFPVNGAGTDCSEEYKPDDGRGHKSLV